MGFSRELPLGYRSGARSLPKRVWLSVWHKALQQEGGKVAHGSLPFSSLSTASVLSMSMHYEDLIGRSLALVLIEESESEEDQWYVLPGIIEQQAEEFYCVFPDDLEQKPIRLHHEWQERIREVSMTEKSILKADFGLSLRIGFMREGADPADFISTGLQLPD
jgi:hypothetical protein